MAQRILENNRAAYVKFKCSILRDCCLRQPSQEKLAELLDEKKTTIVDVDAYFHKRLTDWQ